MTEHELKIWPRFYEEVESGRKTYELRKDDRDFQCDDTLVLKEYDPDTKKYSGRQVVRRVTSIMRTFAGLEHGFCLMSIAPLEDPLRTELVAAKVRIANLEEDVKPDAGGRTWASTVLEIRRILEGSIYGRGNIIESAERAANATRNMENMGKYVREAFAQEFGEEDPSPLIDLVRHAFITLTKRGAEKRTLEKALKQLRDELAKVPETVTVPPFDELDCILSNVEEIRKQPEMITWEQDIWLTTIMCHAKMLIRKRNAKAPT
jgi:Domain of unknown function (DUF3850)